jgi:WD40 repeat protein
MSFAAVLARLAQLENPYPGLRPFDTNEAHLFFGRDQQVLDLSDRLGRNHFVAVLGLSGSGKSSLVRAGLIPALERGRLLEPGRTWRVAVMRPSGVPFANLAAELKCDPATLRASSHGLIDFARQQLTAQEALLVVVDQFEELFRYKDSAVRSTAGDAGASSEAAAFIALLLASARSPLPIYIVITMRTDYLGDCAEFPEFPDVLNESQYLVPRLTREQRRQAIEGPLGRVRISSALVERILNDAGDEPDQLPILQHALMRTWTYWHTISPGNDRPIENKDYEAVGGFSGALNRHADELLKTPAVLAAPAFVEIIFKRLTALGRGNRERRDPSQLSELWDLCNAKPEESRQRVSAILDVFRQGEATFLAPREGELSAGTYIDIAHESLIRNWKILANKWLPEEEKQAKTLVELVARARGWRAHERDVLTGLDLSGAMQWDRARNASPRWAEHYAGVGALEEVQAFLAASRKQFQQSARRSKLLVSFLVVLLLGALVFAFQALYEQKVAESLDLAGKAESLVSLGRSSEALVTARQAFSIDESAQARAAMAHAFPQQLTNFKGHSASVFNAAFSPDERQIVSASGDGTAQVWDAATGQLIAKLAGHNGEVRMAVFSPEGQRVATASSDRSARVWNVATGQPIAKLEGHLSDVNTAAFSPDGQRVVTASRDGTARVWNAASGQTLATLEGHQGIVNMAAFSADGERIITAGNDGTARLWNAGTGQVITIFQGHKGDVKTVAFSPDGTRVVTASADHTARLWNVATGQTVATMTGHGNTVNAAAFSPNGKLIVTASEDQTAAVWNATTGQLMVKLEGHSGAVNTAMFSADSQRVVTASHDNTARVWNAATGDLLANLTGHAGPVAYAGFSLKGLRVLTAGEDNTARVWNIAAAAQVLATLTGHSDGVNSAAFSPDGQRILTASGDQTARIWNAMTDRTILKLTGHADSVNSASYSANGQSIVTASSDHTACVWNSTKGQVIAKLIGHSDSVNSAVFSPDGTLVLTASSDHSARIWNATTGRMVSRLEGQRGVIANAAFSPDGQRVATASDDKTAWIWNASTGQVMAKLTGHAAAVWTVAFSPDGQRLVTASDDGTARIWNAATAQVMLTLAGHSGAVYCAAFSPDGKNIVTASYDETVRVWDASTGEVVAKLEGHSDSISTAAFSHDGQRIVTASLDRTSLVFRLVPLDEITNLLKSK